MYQATVYVMTLGSAACLIILVFNHKHFLMILLLFEVFMLSLITAIPVIMMMSHSVVNAITAVVLLTLGACEASLGLSLLVLAVRSFGNDKVSSMSKHTC